MPEIKIFVKNRVARADTTPYVCGNTDYRLVFDFDEEWSEYDAKTARFAKESGYEDVIFIGNECPIPATSDTYYIYVGVYAGDLRTTTPARVACRKSILCGSGLPDPPSPDVYAQIIEMLNDCLEVADRAEQFRDEADQAAKASAESAETAVEAATAAAKSAENIAEHEANCAASAKKAGEQADRAQKIADDMEITDTEALEMLAECGVVTPACASDGTVYTLNDKIVTI